MKITCKVDILYRNYPPKSPLAKKHICVATLALCYKPGQQTKTDKDALLFMCTQKNSRVTKYRIHRNVDKLLTEYINEGKATVRFKQPPLDLLISEADPLQLKEFLHGVELTIAGKGTGKIHFSTPPTEVDKPEQKQTIMTCSKYPSVKKGFPPSLTSLQAQACSIRKIDQRILSLHNLQVLDLANNFITELPVGMAEIKLQELIIRNNQIEYFPPELATGPLGQSLKVLDLSHNKIADLSPYFCLMKNLSVLQLKCNKLDRLPHNIHNLESLTMFNAAHNELKTIPFGITKLSLDILDLFYNPLNKDVKRTCIDTWETPSLLECAASAIVEHKIQYTAKDYPPRMRKFMIEHCPCPCGKSVFRRINSCILMYDLQKLASTVVYISNSTPFKVPLEVYFCSLKCWREFDTSTANQND